MISPEMIERLSKEFPRYKEGIANCATLLSEGAAIPFIARYRRPKTHGMNEADVRMVSVRLRELEELERRRRSMLRTMETIPGLLTPERKEAFERCPDLQTLEDLYAPIRPKKNEEINQAQQKGLDPLADLIQRKDLMGKTLSERANEYVDAARGVNSAQEALDGAKKILVERVFDDPEWRRLLRLEMREKGVLVADPIEGKSKNAEKYKSQQGHKEALHSIPSHRMLALRRAEREKAVKLRIEIDDAAFVQKIEEKVIGNLASDPANQELADFLKGVVQEAYRHLRERCGADVRLEVKERADDQAIQVAVRNIRHLLLSPAFGSRQVIGIDVGARNASWVLVDEKGQPGTANSLPVLSDEEKAAFVSAFQAFLQDKKVEGIAMGGSAQARPLLSKVRESLRAQGQSIDVVYWADSIAESYTDSAASKKEFPDLDAATRSAIFMARRFQDPLAELVKLDPKDFGIGQYQHDVGRFRLTQALLETIQSCVCRVGANPNESAVTYLKYIPGLSESLAQAIVDERAKNGVFAKREDLKRVPGIDEKVYDQACGFLTFPAAESALEKIRIHPEQAWIAEKIAGTLNLSMADLVGNRKALGALDRNTLVAENLSEGMLQDVIDILFEGSRDSRGRFRAVSFRKDVNSVADLQPEMTLEGIVSNVTNFGAFVDIGLEQDGLVHISELADRFVRLPHEIVRLGAIVNVRVIGVDKEKGRVSLSMRPGKEPQPEETRSRGPRARVAREPQKPLFVRAATFRRDGLMKPKEELARERLSGEKGKDGRKGGPRGDKKGGPKKNFKGRGGPREQMQELDKLDARSERCDNRRERQAQRQPAATQAGGAPVATEPSDNKEKLAKKAPVPEKKSFSNNPFQSFFQKSSPEPEAPAGS